MNKLKLHKALSFKSTRRPGQFHTFPAGFTVNVQRKTKKSKETYWALFEGVRYVLDADEVQVQLYQKDWLMPRRGFFRDEFRQIAPSIWEAVRDFRYAMEGCLVVPRDKPKPVVNVGTVGHCDHGRQPGVQPFNSYDPDFFKSDRLGRSGPVWPSLGQANLECGGLRHGELSMLTSRLVRQSRRVEPLEDLPLGHARHMVLIVDTEGHTPEDDSRMEVLAKSMASIADVYILDRSKVN